MKHCLSLFSICFLLAGFSRAQITGSDTVCAGYIYNYSATIPGAVSYNWSVPANWYDLMGQGSSLISVTCNFNPGNVCVEGFDSVGISLGTQCLLTYFGTDGGGNYHLEPNGINEVCDGMTSVNIIPVLVYDGPGGAGCLQGCGNGTPHPNIIWGIYAGQFFQGVVGTMMSLGIGIGYTVAYVDITYGSDFPQARLISGCGGTVSGSFSFNPIGLWPMVYFTPNSICVGDTFLINGNGSTGGCSSGIPVWSQFTNLTPLTTLYDPSQLQVVATGTPIQFSYAICSYITSGYLYGSICWEATALYFVIPTCPVVAGFQAGSTTVCENSCINFSNASIHATNYQWSFPGANPSSSTDVNPANICYVNAGSYDVTLIASNPDYADTLFLPGYIQVVASPLSSFQPGATAICSGECISFSNSSVNAATYQWSFPGGNPSASTDTFPPSICYSSAGIFDVMLICVNQSCQDTFLLSAGIEVTAMPQAGFSAGQVNLCPGTCTDFINLTVLGDTYQWSFPGSAQSSSTEENPSGICYPDSGHYDVTLVAVNGNCTDTLTYQQFIFVYPPPPLISIQQISDTLIASAGFSFYQWYWNGNLIPGATDGHYIAVSNGDYNVVALDSNDCEVEAVVYNVITGVPEIRTIHDNLVTFPNPAFDHLEINLPMTGSMLSEMEVTLKILDLQGRMIKYQLSRKNSISVSELNPGIYLLEVVTPENIFRGKLVKR